MSNDNYCAALTSFVAVAEGAQAYYRATEVGPFNQVSPEDGSFCAYVTFILRGDIQAAAWPTCDLWGNLLANRGWGLSLNATVDGDGILTATVGDGTTVGTAQYKLTGDASSATVPFNAVSPIERLIMAGIWWTGADLFLTINGSIVAVTEALDPLVASAAFATLGASADGQRGATPVDIVAAGYSSNLTFGVTPQPAIGGYAGVAFAAARDTMGCNLLYPDAGIDWEHNYNIRTAVQGTVGNISKTAAGTRVAPSLPLGPASLPDSGNRSTSPATSSYTPTTVAPAALARIGAALPRVIGRKNVDWYAGGTPFVPIAP